MNIINKLNIKILLTVYLLLNLANQHRIGYMAGFALMCGKVLGESTIINSILFYACVVYGIIIHIALIASIVLVYRGKHRPFIIVSIIDFVVYALMAMSLQFIFPFSLVILISHLLILSLLLLFYYKKQTISFAK